jgi:hypothetical protein
MKKMTNIKKFLERNNIEYASKLVYSNLEEITFYINDLKFEISNPMKKNFFEIALFKKEYSSIDGYAIQTTYAKNSQKEINKILENIINELE